MNLAWKLLIIAIIVIVGVVIAVDIAYNTSSTIKTVTVKEKWVKQYGDGSKYLFSDQDGNVYSIEDTIWLWNWNASDRWAKLDVGKTYEIKTYGWRIQILSGYPNAVEITLVP